MRWAIVGSGWLWGLAALPQVTDAALSFGAFLLLVPSGLLIGFAWFLRTVWLVWPGRTREGVPDRCRPLLWLSVPVIGIGSLLLLTSTCGLAARVRLCETELQRHAEAARQNPDISFSSGRVGLFDVRYTSADDKQVKLYTTSAGFMDSAGIVYRPDGNPPEYCHQKQHLYGPWWWFREDF
ncbi:MAG: hypothetical protein FJ304_10235 [Planctomycetes bacterium]|nr:hypothetical protein [Planctomycetota bacterium]